MNFIRPVTAPLPWRGLLLASLVALSSCQPDTTGAQGSDPGPDSALVAEAREDSAFNELPVTDTATSTMYIEGEFTMQRAMEVIYGMYDQEMECSQWVCKPREQASFKDKISKDGKLYTRAGGVYDIESAEGNKKLLITETLNREGGGWEGCHACAPLMGAAMFVEIDGAWFIQALKKDIAVMGSWGQIPPHRLMQAGADTWVVCFTPGYTAQGETTEGTTVMGVLEGSFRILADFRTAYDNSGYYGENSESTYGFKSHLSFVPGNHPVYYDLKISTRGKRPEDGTYGQGAIMPFTETRHFIMGNEGYELVDSTVVLESM